MKTVFFALLISIFCLVSCGSDDDGPSTVTENLAYGVAMTIDIPGGVLTPTQTVSQVFELDYSEIDSINGDPNELILDQILIEFDSYQGADAILLTGGTFVIKDANDVQITALTLDGIDINLKEYDDANFRLDATITDAETVEALEERLLNDGELHFELTAEVSDVPAKFDFIPYMVMRVTGPL